MKYVIQKVSNDLLFYVDRSKTKKFWWSYKPYYALLFDSKEAAENKIKQLNYGSFKVITETEMRQKRKDKDLNYELNKKFNYTEHPFSSEGLGQW